MLDFFQGEEVIIVSTGPSGEVDEWGNDKETETQRTVTAIVRFIQTNATTNAYQTVADTEVSLLFPEGTVIDKDDTFIVRGTNWEQDGSVSNMFPEIRGRFIPMPVVVRIKRGEM
jgi:hypothetical protein